MMEALIILGVCALAAGFAWALRDTPCTWQGA